MKVIDGDDLAGRRLDVDLSRAPAGSAGVQLATSAAAMAKTSPSITFITIIGLAESNWPHCGWAKSDPSAADTLDTNRPNSTHR